MPLAEKLCFVQFLHPQSEPTRNSGSRWNTGKHVRKYLCTDGAYLDGDQAIDGPIEFWGEWEAESVVAREFRSGDPQGPRRVWRPCYEKKTDYCGLQNTDPFVFEGSFTRAVSSIPSGVPPSYVTSAGVRWCSSDPAWAALLPWIRCSWWTVGLITMRQPTVRFCEVGFPKPIGMLPWAPVMPAQIPCAGP